MHAYRLPQRNAKTKGLVITIYVPFMIHYFNKQYFLLIAFQCKHQHKLNLSDLVDLTISERTCTNCMGRLAGGWTAKRVITSHWRVGSLAPRSVPHIIPVLILSTNKQIRRPPARDGKICWKLQQRRSGGHARPRRRIFIFIFLSSS